MNTENVCIQLPIVFTICLQNVLMEAAGIGSIYATGTFCCRTKYAATLYQVYLNSGPGHMRRESHGER